MFDPHRPQPLRKRRFIQLWTRRWRSAHFFIDAAPNFSTFRAIVALFLTFRPFSRPFGVLDSVMGFQQEGDATRFLAEMSGRLAKFGLTMNETKTRLIEFGRFAAARRKRRGLRKPETFNFLGFTHCCSRNRQGQYKLLRLTVKKRMRTTIAAIREKLMSRRHEPIAEVGKWLNRVVQGYFNYHAIPGNLSRLNVPAETSAVRGDMRLCAEASGTDKTGSGLNALSNVSFHPCVKYILILKTASLRHTPKAGAVCGNTARRSLNLLI
jgi:hypothetical protein